jgi:hypothetical protein
MNFQNEYVECVVEREDNDVLYISGYVTRMDQFDRVEIFAANPIDRMVNYTGSGQPFPCSRIAFEGTPNYKVIGSKSGGFDVRFKYPNSYYTEDQFTRIPPCIFFKMSRANSDPVFVRFELPLQDDVLNVRTLTYRTTPRQGPEYYAAKEIAIPICGAEKTMRLYRQLKIEQDLV